MRPNKRSRRTATTVLAGHFDPRPTLDTFTDIANPNHPNEPYNSMLGYGPGILFDARPLSERERDISREYKRLAKNARRRERDFEDRRKRFNSIARDGQRGVDSSPRVPPTPNHSPAQGAPARLGCVYAGSPEADGDASFPLNHFACTDSHPSPLPRRSIFGTTEFQLRRVTPNIQSFRVLRDLVLKASLYARGRCPRVPLPPLRHPAPPPCLHRAVLSTCP